MLRLSSFMLSCGLSTLMFTTGAVQAAGGDPVHGGVLFKKHCNACHNIMKGATPDIYGVILPLQGIIGRESAQTKGFFYSKAMRDSKVVWSEEFLDTYIKDPKGTIPGIRMEFYGLESAADRQDIIAHILMKQDDNKQQP